MNLSRSIFLSFLFTLRIYFCAILKQNSKSIVCPIRKKAVFNAYLLCFTERKQIFIIKCSESRLTFNTAVLQTVAKKYCYRRQNPERRIGFMNIREFLLTFNPAVLLTVAKKYRYRRQNPERRIGFMNIREFLLTFNPAVLLTVAKKYRYRRRNLERRIGAA